MADRESNYCVWKYLADNGRPTDTAKVARLLMTDDKEIKKTEQVFKKLLIEEDEF